MMGSTIIDYVVRWEGLSSSGGKEYHSMIGVTRKIVLTVLYWKFSSVKKILSFQPKVAELKLMC